MAKVSCIIPAYNEAESIPHLWARLQPVLQSFPDWEAIFVNDGSTDTTAEIIKKIQHDLPQVKLVSLPRNQGKSAVLMAGFAAATGDYVVTIDADLQDEPEEIPKLIAKLEAGPYDVVGGWKQHRQDPFVKLVSSKVFNFLASRIAHETFHDLNCGLKAYRREVLPTIDLYGDLYRFIPILAATNGWRVAELPVAHHPREHGVSKYGLRLGGIFDLITLSMIAKYRWRPLHLFGRWGAIMFFIGLVMLAYLVVLHFQGQAIGNRPLLTFAVLFVLGGLQLIFTGLLGDLIVQSLSRRK